MTTHPVPIQQPPDSPTNVSDIDQRAATSGHDQHILWVDPRELIIGDNVRTDVTLTKGFIADIKDRGVRQVIPVHRNELGQLVLQTGQKRVFAAIQAGLERVRVLVEPQPLTNERDQAIARIIDQLGENEHRTPIHAVEEARATQQLLDLGLTAGQIARRRHIGTHRVRTAVTVAQSETAMDALTHLTQSAVLAEFADDPAAITTLTTAAQHHPDQFDHLAQQLRDARAEARLRTELTITLTTQGIPIIERPDTLFGGPIRRLTDLTSTTSDTKPSTGLTVEEHAACPGHAAFLDDRGSLRPPDQRVVPVWVCTDFLTHGHTERYTSSTATSKASGPMTEQQKAERREIIVNNKAWNSATTVRRAWLTRFFARKTVPADAARWIAQTLAGGCHDLRRAMESGHPMAAELLGLLRPDCGPARFTTRAIIQATAKASPTRASTLTVAILVAALEAGTSRHTWRAPTADHIDYFRQLQRWNYPLSEVELLVITPTDTDRSDGSTTPAQATAIDPSHTDLSSTEPTEPACTHEVPA